MTQNHNPLLVLAASLFSATVALGQTHTATIIEAVERLPRDLEMELALSSLPAHLRQDATVYLLDPTTGFEVARIGTNGFHAFVARTGDDTFLGSWPLRSYRDDILYPIAFDDAGRKTHMRIFFDTAELQAKGTEPAQLKKLMQDRFNGGFYKVPARPGVAYMLAPIMRTYVSPELNDAVATASFPHVMYYAPFVSNDEIGGAQPGGMNPFIVLPGWHGYMIQAIGSNERAAIRSEYGQMLARLCVLKTSWCLPTP